MRTSLLSVVIWAAALSACAQPSPPTPTPKGWARVQALPPNATIHIKADSHTVTCRIKAVQDDSLTCLRSGTEQSFQRSAIQSIKVSRRAQSTVAGLAIGGGIGAGIGAATGKNDGILGRGAFAGLFAVPLAVLGAIIGAATDFTHSTIYRQ